VATKIPASMMLLPKEKVLEVGWNPQWTLIKLTYCKADFIKLWKNIYTYEAQLNKESAISFYRMPTKASKEA